MKAGDADVIGAYSRHLSRRPAARFRALKRWGRYLRGLVFCASDARGTGRERHPLNRTVAIAASSGTVPEVKSAVIAVMPDRS